MLFVVSYNSAALYNGTSVICPLAAPFGYDTGHSSPSTPKFSRGVGGENDTRDTDEKYVRRRVLFARNTSSLGEFDFLNFRRFIVASVALLSSSSNGNGIDRPHWIMARESG